MLQSGSVLRSKGVINARLHSKVGHVVGGLVRMSLVALMGVMLPCVAAQAESAPDWPAKPAAAAERDMIPPTLIGSDLTGPESGVYTLRLTFSEVIAPLAKSDFQITNATITLRGDGAVYFVTITPVEHGYIAINLPLGAVLDQAGNANTQSYGVNLYDASLPVSVELFSDARDITGRAPIAIQAQFSEPVSGFSVDDVRVSGGAVTGISGAGARYTIAVQPSGAGDLTLAIPADVALTDQGIGNLASDTLRLGNPIVALNEARISTFMLHRADALLAAQPDLIARLRHRSQKAFALKSEGGEAALTFRQAWGGAAWADLSARRSRVDGVRSDYLLAALGVDLVASERFLFGAMVQFDRMEDSDDTGFVRGDGWLLGPYLAGKIGDHALFYEARLLYGQSSNSLSVDGGDVVSQFDTRRWLGSLGLAGEIQRGGLTLTPSLVLSKISDQHSAFVDGYGNQVSAGRIDLLQGEIGIDLQRSVASRAGELRVNGGGALIFSDGAPLQATGGRAVADLRGKTWIGLERAAQRGLSYAGDVTLDGLGTGKITPQVRFNWHLEF